MKEHLGIPTKPPLKQSVYMPTEIIEEMKAEAARQDRPLSYLVRRAWEIARERFKEMPTVERAA